jgi:hypothetical protein
VDIAKRAWRGIVLRHNHIEIFNLNNFENRSNFWEISFAIGRGLMQVERRLIPVLLFDNIGSWLRPRF